MPVISPGLARVSKIETVSTQGNARKKGDKNASKTAASEANIEGPSERESDILPLLIV